MKALLVSLDGTSLLLLTFRLLLSSKKESNLQQGCVQELLKKSKLESDSYPTGLVG